MKDKDVLKTFFGLGGIFLALAYMTISGYRGEWNLTLGNVALAGIFAGIGLAIILMTSVLWVMMRQAQQAPPKLPKRQYVIQRERSNAWARRIA